MTFYMKTTLTSSKLDEQHTSRHQKLSTGKERLAVVSECTRVVVYASMYIYLLALFVIHLIHSFSSILRYKTTPT
ncbi:hypothetical protein BDV18DRAFT_143722 [Aspergillus unguis]